MKDVIKGYRQMLAGLFGLIVLMPGIFLCIGALVLLAKYIYKLAIWLWLL